MFQPSVTLLSVPLADVIWNGLFTSPPPAIVTSLSVPPASCHWRVESMVKVVESSSVPKMLTVPAVPVNVPRSATWNVSPRWIVPPVWVMLLLLSQLPRRIRAPLGTLTAWLISYVPSRSRVPTAMEVALTEPDRLLTSSVPAVTRSPPVVVLLLVTLEPVTRRI